MGIFAKASKQAADVMKQLQGKHIKSVGTVRNYEQSLKGVAQYLKDTGRKGAGLQSLTLEQAKQYLDARSEEVGQKQLDMDRQAIQVMLKYVTGKLSQNERLEVVKSEKEQIINSRAYTAYQVHEITKHQREHNALATQIVHAAGLRAHELYTLRPATEQSPSVRPARVEKFRGREGVRYTVNGKGGLVREVVIPSHLANKLEAYRLDAPKEITDRNIRYYTRYNIKGGVTYSKSFSAASKTALGWSNGAHGLRHSYAQERMEELRTGASLSYRDALEVVSQEMGHFRPEITETYLR